MNSDTLRRRAVVIAGVFDALDKVSLSLEDRISVLREVTAAVEATKKEADARKAEVKAVTP